MPDLESLQCLLTLCPVRLQPVSSAPSSILPPGLTLARTGEHGRVELLVAGFDFPFILTGGWPPAGPRLRLESPAGAGELEFLPDARCCPPGHLSPRQLRRYYDQLLHQLLRRQLPAACRPEVASSGRDPRGRFSGCFARLAIRRLSGWSAGMAIYPGQGPEAASAFLAAALAWFYHCRNRHRQCDRSLFLFFHSDLHLHLAGRLLLLDSRQVLIQAFRYDFDSGELQDLGRPERFTGGPMPVRFDFRPARPLHANPLAGELVRQFESELQLENTPHAYDLVTCRGLPLLQIHGPAPEDLRTGWSRPRQAWCDWKPGRLEEWLEEVIRIRQDPSPRPRHPAYRLYPERWMEGLLLENLTTVLPGLKQEQTCRQVPACRGGGRSIMDVLSLTADGRLCVMEIKAQEDIALLFQALDYWDRVREGLFTGAFLEAGYFRDSSLAAAEPLLFLITPLFRYHRSLQLQASFLRPGLSVHHLEVPLRWRRDWRIVRRTFRK